MIEEAKKIIMKKPIMKKEPIAKEPPSYKKDNLKPGEFNPKDIGIDGYEYVGDIMEDYKNDNSQKFKKIMITPEDSDFQKGINSLPGNEPMKKEFTKLPKFRNRSQKLRHARNVLGIGLHLTGKSDGHYIK